MDWLSWTRKLDSPWGHFGQNEEGIVAWEVSPSKLCRRFIDKAHLGNWTLIIATAESVRLGVKRILWRDSTISLGLAEEC